MKNTGLCYIEHNGMYLMLHRVKKENDENRDKWIGIGGKFEEAESPEDCILRELSEECGIVPAQLHFRGIVTFISEKWGTEYMHLFTAECTDEDFLKSSSFPCDEGVLEWVPVSEIPGLPIWEGDRLFLGYLAEGKPFFSLKLVYDISDTLTSAFLDGKMLNIS